MTFAGIKSEDEAKSLWAYLKQYDADGKTKYGGGSLSVASSCPRHHGATDCRRHPAPFMVILIACPHAQATRGSIALISSAEAM
jgi:hypothetical protein